MCSLSTKSLVSIGCPGKKVIEKIRSTIFGHLDLTFFHWILMIYLIHQLDWALDFSYLFAFLCRSCPQIDPFESGRFYPLQGLNRTCWNFRHSILLIASKWWLSVRLLSFLSLFQSRLVSRSRPSFLRWSRPFSSLWTGQSKCQKAHSQRAKVGAIVIYWKKIWSLFSRAYFSKTVLDSLKSKIWNHSVLHEDYVTKIRSELSITIF